MNNEVWSLIGEAKANLREANTNQNANTASLLTQMAIACALIAIAELQLANETEIRRDAVAASKWE